MEQELRKNFLINTLYFLTIAAGIFIFCRFLLRYLMPFVVGGAVAWLAQKPAKVICSRTGLKRSVTAGTLALTVFIAVAVLVLLICIKAVNAAAGLFEDIGSNAEMLTKLFKELKDSADSFFEKFPKEITDFLSTLYEKTLNKAAAYFTTAVSSAAGYTVKHAPEFLLSCAVAAVSACYIAADFRRLIKFARGLCGNKIYENGVKIKNILVNSVFKFAKGYLIILGITFAELFAGLALLKINYALLLAAIMLLGVVSCGKAGTDDKTDKDPKTFHIVTVRLNDVWPTDFLNEGIMQQVADKYGVKIKAEAPSIHMIRADIKTEVSPIVGSEKQSDDMVKFLLKEFEEDPKKIWQSNMFGKSLHELINEGLNAKLAHMPYEARMKLADTLQKIINDGAGGLICIIL